MESKDFPLIDDMYVDLRSLRSIAHDCNPDLCADSVFCCEHYEIHVKADEVERVVSYSQLAAEFAGTISEDGDLDNVLDSEDDEDFVIDARDEDGCVFSFKDESISKGRLCSLHAAAMKVGTDPYKVKPSCCTLWPLALAGEEENVLTIQDDAFDFPCNRKREMVETGLDQGVKVILDKLYGAEFAQRVEAHC